MSWNKGYKIYILVTLKVLWFYYFDLFQYENLSINMCQLLDRSSFLAMLFFANEQKKNNKHDNISLFWPTLQIWQLKDR